MADLEKEKPGGPCLGVFEAESSSSVLLSSLLDILSLLESHTCHYKCKIFQKGSFSLKSICLQAKVKFTKKHGSFYVLKMSCLFRKVPSSKTVYSNNDALKKYKMYNSSLLIPTKLFY